MTNSDEKTQNDSTIDEKLIAMTTGRLQEDDQGELKKRLDEDATLGNEATFLKALHQGIQQEDVQPPGDIGLARLKRDIQNERKQAQNTRQNIWKPVAIAACCVMAVQLFLNIPTDDTGTGITVLSGGEHAQGPQLQIIFKTNATEANIRQALNSVQARIINGPGALGVYTLALTEETNVNEAIEELKNLAFVDEALPIKE